MRFPISVFLVLFVALVPGVDPASARPDDLDAVDTWLEAWADAGFLSGCLLVARGDEIVYERCFADANAELGFENGPATRFAIASITKPMQQVLLARLVDRGLLAMDDTLSRPDRGDEFPARGP